MINEHMTASKQCLGLLKSVEGVRLEPYDDQTGKEIDTWCQGATIGCGHLIPWYEWPKFAAGITEVESDELLLKDLEPAMGIIREKVIVSLSQQEFDALVMFVFNIGVGAFAKSSAVKMINDPCAVTKYPSLELAWKAFNKSQGHVMEGLNNRRACEWNVWRHGTYERW